MNIHPETQLVEDADHLKIIEEEELGCHQEFHKYEHPYYITGTNQSYYYSARDADHKSQQGSPSSSPAFSGRADLVGLLFPMSFAAQQKVSPRDSGKYIFIFSHFNKTEERRVFVVPQGSSQTYNYISSWLLIFMIYVLHCMSVYINALRIKSIFCKCLCQQLGVHLRLQCLYYSLKVICLLFNSYLSHLWSLHFI